MNVAFVKRKRYCITMLHELVAKAIREARAKAALTRQDLATLVGVTERAVQYWEHGQKTPGLALLCRIGVACDVSLLDLLHRVDERRGEIARAEET